MAMDELVKVFMEESEDEIRELETGLIKLEEESGDEDTINRVFRAAHTIKGSAGLVGFENVSNYTHTIENILDRIRKKELSVTKKLITTLLESVDFLKRMIAAGSEGEEIDDHEVEKSTGLLKRFAGVAPGTGEQPVGQIRTADKTGDKVLSINMKFRSDILTTGQDPIMLIRELRELGEILESRAFTGVIPDFYNLSPTICYTSWEVILRTTKPLSDIHNVFIFVMDENDITIVDISSQYKGSRPHPRREAHWRDSGGERPCQGR